MTKIETLSALSDHSSIPLEDITLVMPVSVIRQGRTGPYKKRFRSDMTKRYRSKAAGLKRDGSHFRGTG